MTPLVILLVAINAALPPLGGGTNWHSGAQWYATSTAIQSQLYAAGMPASVQVRVWPHAVECPGATQYNPMGLSECAERMRVIRGSHIRAVETRPSDNDGRPANILVPSGCPPSGIVLAVSRGDLLGMFVSAPWDRRGAGVVHDSGVGMCNVWGFPDETYRTCIHETGHALGLADWSGGVMSMESDVFTAEQRGAW